MSKRLFQILDEMNVNDDVNKTATCGCCFDMVSADTVKAGGVVKMGVPAEAITRIFLGECQPFLILLDKKEYHRLKDTPVAISEAEQRAERYEKALKAAQVKAKQGIFPHLPVETMGAQMCTEIDQLVTEALTPKTSTDEQ